MSVHDESNGALPGVIVAVVAAMLVGFVYGYPRLFPAIEASHPDHFEENVASVLEQGNVARAMTIARRATQARPYDPMAYTEYGRTLLADHRPAEALAQLTKAVELEKKLDHEMLKLTRAPFYFAPARVTLGALYLSQDRPDAAVNEFEIARSSATLTDTKFEVYRDALRRSYAGQGLWSRALTFGEPTDPELDALDAAGLRCLAQVCEGNAAWAVAKKLVPRLAAHSETAADAEYLQGRIDASEGRSADSAQHLERAASAKRVHAAYYLGAVLEKSGQPGPAIRAYLSAPDTDPYRPFGLAKAMVLLEALPEAARASIPAAPADILGQLQQVLTQCRALPKPTLHDQYRRFSLQAARAEDAYFQSGGRFPLVTLWQIEHAADNDGGKVSVSGSADGASQSLKIGAAVLQLEWVDNLVYWDGVARLSEGVRPIPGWIDTARDWFKLRAEYATAVQRENGKNCFQVVRPTWLYSVLTHTQGDGGYLAAGRYRGPRKGVYFGWQALNRDGHVESETNLLSGEDSAGWTWQSGYMRSQYQWDTIRMKCDVFPGAAPVSFDDLMLVKLAEPDPALLK